jgi:hypothetical protein
MAMVLSLTKENMIMSYKDFMDDINIMEGMTKWQKIVMGTYIVAFWLLLIHTIFNVDALHNRIITQEQIIQEYQQLYGELPIAAE